MEIAVNKVPDGVVIALAGRMDAVTAPKFDRVMDDLIARGERRIVVDLKDLEYISSAGLQSILAAAKRLEPEGGRIDLAALQGPVFEVFDISGFTSIFHIFDSPAAALQES
ncbi:MAG TPA: STAS domain-containing protein [Syntrophales bacterium]|nr:STAS domain-containing protein [Syntrophales bacterium]HOM07721.1 STAS domain-containing protein [Syntrophales bacterium]HOO00384.1 STAS domain-containing protein [Syntrophales bacterium]HPC01731.1 STAS domain-containing protein [Syntrophales bacterium]HPQ07244.1 STAS domain-containing protein [Syntrophales bacterium]